MTASVQVKIENDYSDGHHSESVVEVEAPGANFEDWANRVVHQHTGDGHGLDRSLGSCYTATVLDGSGRTYEWTD